MTWGHDLPTRQSVSRPPEGTNNDDDWKAIERAIEWQESGQTSGFHSRHRSQPLKNIPNGLFYPWRLYILWIQRCSGCHDIVGVKSRIDGAKSDQRPNEQRRTNQQ